MIILNKNKKFFALSMMLVFNVFIADAKEVKNENLDPIEANLEELRPRFIEKDKASAYPVLDLDKIDGVVVKFVEGSGIRIRNSGKLVPNQSKKLRSKLPEGKTSWLAIDNDLELLQSTFKYYRMKKLRPLFDLS